MKQNLTYVRHLCNVGDRMGSAGREATDKVLMNGNVKKGVNGFISEAINSKVTSQSRHVVSCCVCSVCEKFLGGLLIMLCSNVNPF